MSRYLQQDTIRAMKAIAILTLVVAVIGAIGVIYMQVRHQQLMNWEYYLEGLVAFVLSCACMRVASVVRHHNERRARSASPSALLSYLRRAIIWEHASGMIMGSIVIVVAYAVGVYHADMSSWSIALLVSVGLFALSESTSMRSYHRADLMKAEVARLKENMPDNAV